MLMPLPIRAIRTTFAWLLLFGITGAMLQANSVHAAAPCRADPIVHLSDGNTVQLYTDIYDVPANVKSVAYVLHARVGTTVVSIAYPSDMTTGIPETFRLIADGNDSKYETTTYVSGPDDHVDFVTYAVATLPNGTVSRTFQQNGHVNQLVNQGLDPSQAH
jgi:hypothetical protein